MVANNMSISRPSPEAAVIVRAVTVIIGTVVGLTFLFGFGNVLNLALRLGVPPWVAPLVAPAVDLSVIGLLLGIRHLALAGASSAVLRPARWGDPGVGVRRWAGGARRGGVRGVRRPGGPVRRRGV